MIGLIFFSLVICTLSDNLRVNLGADTVDISAWGSNSLRVRVSPTATIYTPTVQALLPTAPPSFAEVKVSELGISNGNLRADVSANGLVTFTRISDNSVLLTEIGHSFAAIAGGLYSAQIQFQGSADEGIYGLGEHRTGTVRYAKPYYHDFQNSQIYDRSTGADVSIPFYQSTKGYGFLWNLPSFGYININSQYTQWASNSTQQLDYWVTTTNTTIAYSPYADILSHYVDATGHPPAFPEYASGFWQCKDRYRNQTEVLAITQGYYSRFLPIDIFIIDWKHWINVGDFSFNPACWSDPSGLVTTLREHGTRTMVSVWPIIDGASKNYVPMRTAGYLVHDAQGNQPGFHAGQYLYDPFNSDARTYVWNQVKAGYYNNGIKIYWLDASEPERYLPDQSGQYYYKLGRDIQIGMAFPLYHQQTFFDGLKSAGETEVLVLSRSAWAGSQRLGAAVWSGDITSAFSELNLQVRAAQNMALSGIYWWTTDIGGYHSGNIDDPVFRELIVRWFQFGAFCPVFRLHGHRQPEDPASDCGDSGGLNEVWEFGQTAYNVISDVILLREQLRGYVMDNMRLASMSGIPILRPIFFDFPNDPRAYTAEDQFMFGPDWLVAPVLQYQATSRTVYLPALPQGQVWTHFYTNQDYSAGQVTVPTPITSFPLFFRRIKPRESYFPATQFFSKERNDSVLCISQICLSSNCESCSGNYVTVRIEGYTVTSDTTGTIPLKLWYSSTYQDNFVSTDASPPDSTYTVSFSNGMVFSNSGPGLIPLDLFANPNTKHHITVATAEGHQWAKDNGFNLVKTQGYIYANIPPQ